MPTPGGEPRRPPPAIAGRLARLMPSRSRGNLADQLFGILLKAFGLLLPALFVFIVLRIGR